MVTFLIYARDHELKVMLGGGYTAHSSHRIVESADVSQFVRAIRLKRWINGNRDDNAHALARGTNVARSNKVELATGYLYDLCRVGILWRNGCLTSVAFFAVRTGERDLI